MEITHYGKMVSTVGIESLQHYEKTHYPFNTSFH